jgi:hypothetical protein
MEKWCGKGKDDLRHLARHVEAAFGFDASLSFQTSKFSAYRIQTTPALVIRPRSEPGKEMPTVVVEAAAVVVSPSGNGKQENTKETVRAKQYLKSDNPWGSPVPPGEKESLFQFASGGTSLKVNKL